MGLQLSSIHFQRVLKDVTLCQLLLEIREEDHQVIDKGLDPNLEQVSSLVLDALMIVPVFLQRYRVLVVSLLQILLKQEINELGVRSLVVHHGNWREGNILRDQ